MVNGRVLLDARTIDAALRRKKELEEADARLACPFAVSFMTHFRRPEYIHSTLRSFLERDPLAAFCLPVNLIVGGMDADYVRPYEEFGLARVFPLSTEEARRMESFPVPGGQRVHFRANTNCLRSLRLGVGGEQPLLVFEDDVSFTRDWLRKFVALLGNIHAVREDGFLLTLYSPIDFPGEGPEVGGLEAKYFYGTQGVYHPPSARRKIAAYVERHGVERYGGVYDLLMRDCCIAESIPILVARSSLIQHEGMVTTGMSPDPERCHRSPTFREE